MKIIAASVVSYQRSMPRPIVTAHGQYQRREGFLLLLRDELGNIGAGDAAPLPGLSTDTLEECGEALRRLTKTADEYKSEVPLPFHFPTSAAEYFSEQGFVIHGGQPHVEDLERWFSDTPDYFGHAPAAYFAIATALGELKAKRKKLPLSRAMCDQSWNAVPVNGLITESGVEEVAKQAKSLELDGFTSFKMKVGLRHPADDVERICAVCDASPNARLRLDANGGWDVKWADIVLTNVPRSHIDFVEQPFPRGQVSEAQRLVSKYHVRLALDEEVQTLDEAAMHIRNRACNVLVIKPMVIGRLYQCVLLSERAREAGIEIIYTSSWESDIGIAATLHLAAALGPNPPAMGLSTAGMIAEGIVKNPLRIENGFLKVPEGPGLGMELAPELLKRLK